MQSNKLIQVADELAVYEEEKPLSKKLQSNSKDLSDKITKLLEDGLAALNQRNKYLVATSRGNAAYEEAFSESPLDTQRSIHHAYNVLDREFADLMVQVTDHMQAVKLVTVNEMIDSKGRNFDLLLTKATAEVKKIQPFLD